MIFWLCFDTFRASIYLPQYSSYSYFYQNASLYKVWIYNLWRSLSKQICNRQSRHVQMVKHLVRNIEHYTHTNPKKVLTFVIIILHAHTYGFLICDRWRSQGIEKLRTWKLWECVKVFTWLQFQIYLSGFRVKKRENGLKDQ